MEWANEQVNLWTVECASIPLIAGQATYDVDPTTVMIMAAYITTGSRTSRSIIRISMPMMAPAHGRCDPVAGQQDDRILTSVDRDTYASFPEKQIRESHRSTGSISSCGPRSRCGRCRMPIRRYTLHYYRARELQDASLGGGLQADVPYQLSWKPMWRRWRSSWPRCGRRPAWRSWAARAKIRS